VIGQTKNEWGGMKSERKKKSKEGQNKLKQGNMKINKGNLIPGNSSFQYESYPECDVTSWVLKDVSTALHDRRLLSKCDIRDPVSGVRYRQISPHQEWDMV
jgi:hypothetical protein